MSLVLLGILNQQLAGGAAGGPFDHLETQNVSGVNSLVFAGLGSYKNSYKHLYVRVHASASVLDQLDISFNGSSATYYHNIYNNGGIPSSTGASGSFLGRLNTTGSSSVLTGMAMDLVDAFTTKNKSVKTFGDTSIARQTGAFQDSSADLVSITFAVPAIGSITGRFALYGGN